MMFDCPLSGELFIHVDLHVDGSDENDESLLTMMMVITVEDSDGHDDDNDGGDDDDIYIMMQCLFVCVSRKIINSHFRAERRSREMSSPLGLAGRRPALA